MRVRIELALFDDDMPFSQVEDLTHRVLSLGAAPEAHKGIYRVRRQSNVQGLRDEFLQVRYCLLAKQHGPCIVRLPALSTVGPRIERASAVDGRALYPEHIEAIVPKESLCIAHWRKVQTIRTIEFRHLGQSLCRRIRDCLGKDWIIEIETHSAICHRAASPFRTQPP